ncbi:tetratricopeptide repeat protein [Pelomonas sp. CA6]|uniref:tetratricopeptide repeat protein n=1 Tax=Pelomonas sp. CA6 TaxID=2907999 RepID=UPI001F4BDFA4|nr:tetratricopeptide repeat protein [Pelomonas sp. CA6]MCH7344802.1 tetratricopeptide repeat protein [Pelomonas sp. CA6]
MSQDDLGNPLRSRSPEVVAGLNDFVGGFLAYETRAEAILALADAHPDEPLANAYAGCLWMFLESPEGPVRARHYFARAKAAAAEGAAEEAEPAAWRERQHLRLLQAWIDGELPEVEALAEALSERFPRDLFIVKLRQYLAFNRGDSPAMLRAILTVLPDNQEQAHAHGMAAFAYEQCHRLDQAEAAARRALALQRKEPWAQHALAHVLLTQGRVEEGLAFLESVRDSWVGLNSFMHTHLWWHLALFLLARDRVPEVLALYDREVWGISKSYSQDQIGAVQLLARLEWAGVDVGERWQDLADHIAARGEDTVEPFLSLLYLYGLARAGRPQADALRAAIEARAGQAPAHSREAWAEVAVPAAQGLLALARGAHDEARKRLAQALPGLPAIGGSHAQRDLFHLLQLQAELGAGQLLPVQQALEARRRVDPRDAPVRRVLARVYAGLGLPQLADREA